MSRFEDHSDFELDDSQPVIATVASGLEYRGKDAARRQIKLLTGDTNSRMHFSLVHQHEPATQPRFLDGPLNAHWETIQAAAQKGFAPYVVVNEGGRSDGTIRRIRALFLEGIGVELPTMWHRQPDFLVLGDQTQWCAYWNVRAFPVDDFTAAQAKLAGLYDMEVHRNRLARPVALAGVKHPREGGRFDEIVLVEWLQKQP